MSKKITLKHALPNGEIATRQTARNYTHVLVGTLNVERALASAYAAIDDIPRLAEKRRAEAQKSEKIYRGLLAAGKGNKARNWNGFIVEVDDFYIKCATDALEKTVDETVAEFVKVITNERVAKIENLKAITEPRPEVFSWHGRADLAEKAAGQRHYRNYDFVVEAINHGTR